MKKVAVITRTKSRPILLRRAFDSVRNQFYKDYVWVIVNDGGDVTPVESIVSDAYKAGMETVLIHNKTSIGMEAASNKGIKHSESEYIIIHDDDDTWEPGFLEETVGFLESEAGQRYGGAVSHSHVIKELIEEDKCTIVEKSLFNDFLEEIYLADIARSNSFPPISFLYRRKIYDIVGSYNEALPVLGDWDFNLRFLVESDIAVVPKPLANYHQRIAGTVDNSYGNTVVLGSNKHNQYDTILRNHLLRTDIKNSKVGLGYLVNLERDNRFIIDAIKDLDLVRTIKKLGFWGTVKKIFTFK